MRDERLIELPGGGLQFVGSGQSFPNLSSELTLRDSDENLLELQSLRANRAINQNIQMQRSDIIHE